MILLPAGHRARPAAKLTGFRCGRGKIRKNVAKCFGLFQRNMFLVLFFLLFRYLC